MFHLTSTTILAHTSRSLWKALTTRLEHVRAHNHVIFCLSQNVDEQARAEIPMLWNHSIGCLSAPLPFAPDHVSCSILQVPHALGHPFISNIPGRPPIQVGRYHSNHRTFLKDAYDQSAHSFNQVMGNIAPRAREFDIPDGLDPSVYGVALSLPRVDLLMLF
jgi:hypothetical protein